MPDAKVFGLVLICIYLTLLTFKMNKWTYKYNNQLHEQILPHESVIRTTAPIYFDTPFVDPERIASAPEKFTSSKYTEIVVDKQSLHSVEFRAKIIARNGLNETKKSGGDYFRVNLVPFVGNGIACKVTDLHNGTYNVTTPNVFEGNVTLQAQLIHASETVQILKNKTSLIRQKFVDIKTTFKGTGNGLESSICNVILEPEYRRSEICNYSDTKRVQSWYCVKPTSGECNPIYKYGGGASPKSAKFLKPFQFYFNFNTNFFVDIKGSKTVYSSSNKSAVDPSTLPPCHSLSDTFSYLHNGKVSGYFKNNKWISFICSTTDEYIKNKGKFAECLRDKNLHLLGDSTSRQWMEYLEQNMKSIKWNARDKTSNMPKRIGRIEYSNTNIYLHSHGMPMQVKGDKRHVKYISDILDDVTTDENVVVMSLGLHLLLYHPSVFLMKVKAIKDAVKCLVERHPKTQVFVRYISMHQYTWVTPSPWLSQRFNDILRAEFEGMTNVRHLNTWDMTSVVISRDVHPGKEMVEKQIALFQSFLCKN